jgi:glycerate kinase
VVITGEGKLDRQTLAGKAPAGVARMARALKKPVFAIVGQATGESEGAGTLQRLSQRSTIPAPIIEMPHACSRSGRAN